MYISIVYFFVFLRGYVQNDSMKQEIVIRNLEDIDRAAGRAVDKAGKFAKDVGKKVGVTAKRAKRAGSWVKKNKGKVALGAGAVATGAYAAKDDKNSVKSQLAKIKAKDPSERTASEKRLLRLMAKE